VCLKLGRRCDPGKKYPRRKKQQTMMILLFIWFFLACELSVLVKVATAFHHAASCPLSNSWIGNRGCVTKRHLFFQSGAGPAAKRRRRRPPLLPTPSSFDADGIKDQLRDQPGYRLRFELSSAEDGTPPGGPPPQHARPVPLPPVLVLDRANVQHAGDLRAIVAMNIREYGRGPAVLPWDNPKLWGRYAARQALVNLIEWSMRCKLLSTDDHLIYVAKLYTTTTDSRDDSRNIVDCYVGMIEVSLQPVLPQRNPPPFPIPLPVKRWIASAHGVPMQGWISNLLVVPEYRGAGYSKLLVRAGEAVAQREWDCHSIHLHCDADPGKGGTIARQLYATLGYQTLPNNQSQVSIDGVPLLYLSKRMQQ
jgi:Acetyltransferase (GNAT) family